MYRNFVTNKITDQTSEYGTDEWLSIFQTFRLQ